MALVGAGPLAQTASLIGLEGLNLITPLLFATPALIFYTFPHHPKNIYPLALSVTTLLAMASFGVFRLINHQTTYAPQVKLRLMQPNLAQDAKFRAENGSAILEHYLMLSTQGVRKQKMSSHQLRISYGQSLPFLSFSQSNRKRLQKSRNG